MRILDKQEDIGVISEYTTMEIGLGFKRN